MSRSIAEALYERLLSSYPSGRAYAKSDWAEGPMPTPVRHFLVHLLRHQGRHERERLQQAGSAWFDYTAPGVQDAMSDVQDALFRSARVPAEEWTSTLQQATQYVTAHLFRPAPILTNFVFGQDPGSLPLDRVRWRMRFFQAYSYLPNAVEAYAERREVQSFARDDFEQFLIQIDQRLTGDYSRDQWMDLLQPLLDLTETATGRTEVPIRRLRAFFADKNHELAVRRLQQLEGDGQTRIGTTGLRRVLRPERSPEQRDSAEQRAPEAEPLGSASDTSPGDARRFDADVLTAGTTTDDEATPLWKRFQQRPAASSGDGTSGDDPASETATGHSGPLWAQFRASQRGSRAASFEASDAETASNARGDEAVPNPADALSAPPFPSGGGAAPTDSAASNGSTADRTALEALERDVLGRSDPPQRGVFVRQLFRGDLDGYTDVLRRLHHAENWGEASQVIARDVFRAHKINIYSDAAVAFTNAVEQRFRG